VMFVFAGVFEFILLVLAHGQLVDSWNNASILSRPRGYVEARADAYHAGHKRYWWAEMLTCTFCMSHWAAAFGLVAFVAIPAALSVSSWTMGTAAGILPLHHPLRPMLIAAAMVTFATRGLLLGLAAVLATMRAGWILNSYLPAGSRYDRGQDG
jgi:hypothetical protein